MEVLRISGGHKFRLKYGPSKDIRSLSKPRMVAFSSRGLDFLKPRVLVNEGDVVELGQPLVEHKKDSRIKFLSPAAGHVHEVRFGPRRVLEAVVIAVDENKENAKTLHKKYSEAVLRTWSKADVENALLSGGFWGYLDCFPGWGFAPLTVNETGDLSAHDIAAVHINLVKTQAHSADPKLLLREHVPEIKASIIALSKLSTHTRVYVPKGSEYHHEFASVSTVIEVVEKYPVENLGVQAFYAGGLSKNQCVVGIDAELLVDIGHFLLHGRIRNERIYCLAGNAVIAPSHVKGRVGAAIGDLTDGALKTTEDVRLIAGGLLSGTKVRFQDFLGAKDLSLLAMVEDKKRIPLVFFRLGADRLTMSRAWLGGFKNHEEREATTNNNGEERACIQCGSCIDICPVKLMPNLIMKAVFSKDIEKMEWLSIHDCVNCGLCTFVCPSKIELGQAFETGKQLILKEG